MLQLAILVLLGIIFILLALMSIEGFSGGNKGGKSVRSSCESYGGDKGEDVKLTTLNNSVCYSYGTDITKRMVEIGAPALPEGGRYLYFDILDLAVPGDTPDYRRYTPGLAAYYNGRAHGSKIPVRMNPEASLLSAAKVAYKGVEPDLKLEDGRNKLKDFLSKRSMPVIGEPSDKWLEDKQ